ncbi:MAG: MazG nucleotide pyrophosphohydrolase domain-containing protein [Eubacteriales bacterium]|nr:MazG nucleotide pyrophosphohydrolase domain-containing protein [Eubacteriales bacterium]
MRNKNTIFSETEESAALAFTELVETIRQLRAPDGCPWDRAQTHESLKAACIEEAAEVVCGINILSKTGKSDSLKEELGDLLLQVLMHSLIAEEEGLFTLEDVIHTIDEKMIRRHPHVFRETDGKSAAESAETDGTAVNRAIINGAETDSAEIDGTESDKADIDGSEITQETLLEDWKQIKAREKQGREWEEPYLFEAFTEAEALIDVARRRKEANS